MRILQVTNGFPPTASAGVERYTYQLSRSLSTRHEVRIFCRVSDPGHADYEIVEDTVDGLTVRRVVNDFKRAVHVRDYYLDRQIESIFRQTLAKWQPDLVHFQHCIGLSASLLDVATRARIPYLLTLHDYWFVCSQVQLLHRRGHVCLGPGPGVDCYDCRFAPDGVHGWIRRARLFQFLRSRVSDDAKRRILGILSRTIPGISAPPPNEALSPFKERDAYMLAALRSVPIILTPSQFVRDLHVKHGVLGERVRALPLGLDLSLWHGAAAGRSEWRGGIRVGYLGTWLQHKGVHVLIKAFRRLADPGATLRILGFPVPGDPYHEQLEELAAEDPRVQLEGYYEHGDLPGIMDGIDVLVIPSLWPETFSIVAREALLSGTPVVASHVGALPEIIRDGENGLLFPSGDVEALTAALASLSAAPPLLARLSEGALASATHIKDMDAHAHEVEGLYESLTSSNPVG